MNLCRQVQVTTFECNPNKPQTRCEFFKASFRGYECYYYNAGSGSCGCKEAIASVRDRLRSELEQVRAKCEEIRNSARGSTSAGQRLACERIIAEIDKARSAIAKARQK